MSVSSFSSGMTPDSAFASLLSSIITRIVPSPSVSAAIVPGCNQATTGTPADRHAAPLFCRDPAAEEITRVFAGIQLGSELAAVRRAFHSAEAVRASLLEDDAALGADQLDLHVHREPAVFAAGV